MRTGVDSAENSQRGYFLTSEKRFLAQRDSAAAAIKASFAKLQTLTAGHPSQQERISRLQAAVDQRIRFLIASSAVFDAQGFNATQPLFKAGHEVMMTVRTIMQEAEQAEQALLVQRKDGALSRIKVILAGIIALLAFVPLLRLVELMGGVIGIDSSVDVGGVFWFELPAASAPRPAAGAADGHGSTGGTDQPEQGAALASGPKRTLLYVEDNPANLELVEQLIVRRSDLKLLTAIDGHLGLAVARLQRPDVILLDINLPGIGGFDLLKMLRDEPATAHIPVLALSANAVPRDIAKGLEAGFFSLPDQTGQDRRVYGCARSRAGTCGGTGTI